jgi:hypothetical protein
LNDTWIFDFHTESWIELAIVSEPDLGIFQRSGHTSFLYNDKMIVFGGIHAVTQELDDICALDLKKQKWHQV